MPAISWTIPASIPYGTALSGTQLNATSTVGGAFAYTPPAGTVLDAGPQTLSATFTPTNTADYTTATATVTLTVNRATPTITWASPASIPFGTALSTTQLNASSLVAGTFAYTPPAGTVLGSGPQTLSVSFTPTDATNYTMATSAVQLAVSECRYVFVVVLENSGYSTVIGNAQMPYLNSLAQQYSSATNYYANTHPSIGNYFVMTAGQIVTNDDGYTQTVDADNVVRRLVAEGRTWKAYAQSIPSPGYIGQDQYPYAQRHNPLSYFSDVRNDPQQLQNLVPLSQLSSDLQTGALPNYGFIVPNLNHDAHDCPVGMASCTRNDSLAAADQFLQETVASLLANDDFLAHGIVIVTWDEADDADITHGGGHVSTVVAGLQVKPGYQSTTLFQHQSLERLTLESLGVASIPGEGAMASSMDDLFRP
jgi:acid phosphatase